MIERLARALGYEKSRGEPAASAGGSQDNNVKGGVNGAYPGAARVVAPRVIRARYDAATVTHENRRHWAMADGMSARVANSPDVRKKLREHARYEVANNCYARGVVNTLADLVIGYGAVLQIRRGRGEPAASAGGSQNGERVTGAGENSEPMALATGEGRRSDQALKTVEALFEEWADEVGLWRKLWTARVAKAQDGEAFAIFRNNERLESPVTLDLQLIEAEQVSHGPLATFDPREVDGVEVDDFGNVLRYLVLPEHPGDGYSWTQEPFQVAPSAMIHWFRVERPGQLRGVPELTPALPLFAQLRRFTLATLTAAETAAEFAAIIKSNLPPDEDEVTDPFAEVEISRGMMLTLPDGRDITQFKAEHPTTTYGDFKREILQEIGRALQLPRAFVLLDASNYNYASGRLDRQAFDRTVETERDQCEYQALRKVFRAWLSEAVLVEGYLPAGLDYEQLPRRVRWLWRQLGHVDRKKEADGAAADLANCTTTLAAECARNGDYWEEVLEQQAVESARKRELGLVTIAPDAAQGEKNGNGNGEQGTGDGEENDVEEQQAAGV